VRNENAPRTRVPQHWQAVAADALEKMLLPEDGTKGIC
jgi:hypothetical protein